MIVRRPLATLTILVTALAAGPALASGETAAGVKYVGETEDGRVVKLVADERGEVIRGAITVETACSEGYDPFRARVGFGKPLDRSGPRGFRDKGSYVEADDRFSARYRYKVEAERENKRVLAGEISLEITFRREGTEYTTCTVEDVVFDAVRKDDKQARGRRTVG